MADKIPKLVSQILVARGITKTADQRAFLNPSYDKDLHDPFLLEGMREAVERILAAQKTKEKVGIFGDYDIDGITATTVLTEAFNQLGIENTAHIPNRFIEGYGMSKDGVDALKEAGVSVIVTVDCGSTSAAEITYANSLGIDVIVTDHHEPPAELPPALAVINPKRSDSKYPFRELAGVGVAFKLVLALQSKTDQISEGQEKWLLDAVAFGSVCDVVPLVDENRALVYWGLKVAQKTRRVGLQVLAEVSGAELPQISSRTFGFVFGPRLNAAGRLETAQHSLDLMLSGSAAEARTHALTLESLNQNRRTQQKRILEEAVVQAQIQEDNHVLVVSGEGWAEGVVGIVASKLVEQFKKPAFVLARIEGGLAKGSARSFGDFSVVEAINDAKKQDLLEKGGGHAMAGGVTLDQENIAAFTDSVNAYYTSLSLKDQLQHLEARPDVELSAINEVSVAVIDELSLLEPFGMGNAEPLFALTAELSQKRMVGSDGNHLKVTLRDETGDLSGIGFSMPDVDVAVGDKVRVVGALQKNEFRGNVTPQIQIKSIARLH